MSNRRDTPLTVAKRKIEDYITQTVMRMPVMEDEELREHLSSMYPTIRICAETEASRRWSETIMPKGDS